MSVAAFLSKNRLRAERGREKRLYQAVQAAALRPLHALPLTELCDAHKRVTVICGEASPVALAALLDLMRKAGVPNTNINVLVAALPHAPRHLSLAGVPTEWHCAEHADELTTLGYLDGIALDVNVRALEADLLIALGGRRPNVPTWQPQGALAALCPGVTSQAIAAELRMSQQLEAQLAGYPEALAHRLPRELAHRLGLTFAVEVVEGALPIVFAGSPDTVDQAAAREVAMQRELRVAHPQYDRLVIQAGASDLFDVVPLIAHLVLHRDTVLIKGAPIIIEAAMPILAGERETFCSTLAMDADPDLLLHWLARRPLREEGLVRAWAWSKVRLSHPLIAVCTPPDEPRARALGMVPAFTLNEAHEIADSLAGQGLVLELNSADWVNPVYAPADAPDEEWESVLNDW